MIFDIMKTCYVVQKCICHSGRGNECKFNSNKLLIKNFYNWEQIPGIKIKLSVSAIKILTKYFLEIIPLKFHLNHEKVYSLVLLRKWDVK